MATHDPGPSRSRTRPPPSVVPLVADAAVVEPAHLDQGAVERRAVEQQPHHDVALCRGRAGERGGALEDELERETGGRVLTGVRGRRSHPGRRPGCAP